MTRYFEIFKEILDITHHDYAGFDEKQGWDDPEFYLKKIEADHELTPQEFAELVNDYLTSFQDSHT